MALGLGRLKPDTNRIKSKWPPGLQLFNSLLEDMNYHFEIVASFKNESAKPQSTYLAALHIHTEIHTVMGLIPFLAHSFHLVAAV